MEKYISRVAYNHEDATHYETPVGKSLTVQGEAYTINELFARHMNGMATNVERPGFYQDVEDFDAIDFDRLRHADPFEKQQTLLQVEEKAKKARQAIEAWQKQQKESETDEKTEGSKKPSKASSGNAKSKTAKASSDAKQSGDATAGNSEDAE